MEGCWRRTKGTFVFILLWEKLFSWCVCMQGQEYIHACPAHGLGGCHVGEIPWLWTHRHSIIYKNNPQQRTHVFHRLIVSRFPLPSSRSLVLLPPFFPFFFFLLHCQLLHACMAWKEVREPTGEGGDRNEGRKGGKEGMEVEEWASLFCFLLFSVEATPFEEKHNEWETEERETKNKYHKQTNKQTGLNKTPRKNKCQINKDDEWVRKVEGKGNGKRRSRDEENNIFSILCEWVCSLVCIFSPFILWAAWRC